MAESQEQFWENLLAFIEERRVIPVVGPELVTIREGERDVPLSRVIGRRLAADLDLPETDLPDGCDLNDVVSLHLRRRGDREEVYPRVRSILRAAAPGPPEALRALAGIRDLTLFVSLTFDSLLADALNAVRSRGPARRGPARGPARRVVRQGRAAHGRRLGPQHPPRHRAVRVVPYVETRRELVTLSALALVLTGTDRKVSLWHVGPSLLVPEACRTANRNLTCQEWRNYMGAGIPYRKTCEALPGPETCK